MKSGKRRGPRMARSSAMVRRRVEGRGGARAGGEHTP